MLRNTYFQNISTLHTYIISVCVCVCLELGEGPFTLSATELNDSVCVFGANVSSGEVFPLLKTSAQPTAIFNLMITSGLYKERASREITLLHVIITCYMIFDGDQSWKLTPACQPNVSIMFCFSPGR